MADPDKQPEDPELFVPDPDPVPSPTRARRADHRRDDRDDEDDEYDDRDDPDEHYRPRGRNMKYDDEGNLITSDDTMWGLFAHLGFIFLGFLAPLIIFLVYRHKSPFVARHAKAALNFAITHVIVVFAWLAVAALIGLATYLAMQNGVVAFVAGYILAIIGSILFGIASLVFAIMATVAAAKGEHYRYPASITFVG